MATILQTFANAFCFNENVCIMIEISSHFQRSFSVCAQPMTEDITL